MQRVVTYVIEDPHGGLHKVAYATVYSPNQEIDAMENCKRRHPEAVGFKVIDGKEQLNA